MKPIDAASSILFKQKVNYIRPRLIDDFEFSVADANAIIGNLAHECNGFRNFQEKHPTVKGSRGGFGWPQWTGPRRRLFEAYCKRNNLDPFSDEANYGYLWVELNGPEKRAVSATKRAVGLANKVKAFERSFERAGVKHYGSRVIWAERSAEIPQTASRPPAKPPAKPKLVPVEEAARIIRPNIFSLLWNAILKILNLWRKP